jgi:hypothetical protein
VCCVLEQCCWLGCCSWGVTSCGLQFPKDDSRCWAQILRFCYTNEWDYDASNVVALRRLAEERGFADFEEVVANAISSVFLKAADRALDVAIGASLEGDDGMAEAAFAATYKNPRIAMESPSFLRLDEGMLDMFASDDRAVANEVTLFRALVRWAEIKLHESKCSDRRDGVLSSSNPTARWDVWQSTERDPDTPQALPLSFTGEAIRSKLGPALFTCRFPRMDGRLLVEEVMPVGVLTDDELAEVLAYAVTPEAERPSVDEVAGFSCAKRTPIEKELRIIMWGGGGASGRYANSGCGGCGGYVRVKYNLRPGETLSLFVGEGGYADQSESVRTTQAWPNSGRGGYNWKTGSGGGATYFTSDKRGGEVVAGAGGGGGGSAGQSWSAGGGGGGGTTDGKVGSCGDAAVSGSSTDREGKDGNGDGGNGDSGGAKKDGKDSNGAGGKAGTGGTRSDGGGGGSASWKHAKLEQKIDGSGPRPIVCPITSDSAGEGAHDGSWTKGGEQKRGSHGKCIIMDMSTGTRKVYEFPSSKTPYTIAFS